MLSPKQSLKNRILLRALIRWWKEKYVSQINHGEVVAHVKDEGRLTSSYSFMATMSCAIATLGLLLSSPAVVIGAMLISPLMSPIMSLGFSLRLLDANQMKKALEAIITGVLLALAMSIIIVLLSPITEPTPEIMARTQPNLFDLLVAIFSGLAGGYAVIKRKGETIVGVAIATALMPPLAVIGFGIATKNMDIATGAFMLFMTNLLAISLSVTLLAKFYGFGSEHSPKHTIWQALLITSVFIALSIPLGVALKNISYHTYVTKTSQGIIRNYFDNNKVRISLFNIKFPQKHNINIDTVILTPDYKLGAEKEVQKLLSQKFSANINFSLDQIVMSKDSILEKIPANIIENNITPNIINNIQNDKLDMAEALRQATFFPTEYIKIDYETKYAKIFLNHVKDLNLTIIQDFESKLSSQYSDWKIEVIPAFQSLPPIFFTLGGDTLTKEEEKKLKNIIWSLTKWKINSVTIVGFASTLGEFDKFNNNSLAYRRASNIATIIKKHNINTSLYAEYKSLNQKVKEIHQGTDNFQRVEIRINNKQE
jgi:uncharacterized hydrophobic protein (TIGR00271 family)